MSSAGTPSRPRACVKYASSPLSPASFTRRHVSPNRSLQSSTWSYSVCSPTPISDTPAAACSCTLCAATASLVARSSASLSSPPQYFSRATFISLRAPVRGKPRVVVRRAMVRFV